MRCWCLCLAFPWCRNPVILLQNITVPSGTNSKNSEELMLTRRNIANRMPSRPSIYIYIEVKMQNSISSHTVEGKKLHETTKEELQHFSYSSILDGLHPDGKSPDLQNRLCFKVGRKIALSFSIWVKNRTIPLDHLHQIVGPSSSFCQPLCPTHLRPDTLIFRAPK